VRRGAVDLALIDLGNQWGSPDAAAHEGRDLGALGPDVVEFEDDRITFTAIAAGIGAQVIEDQSLRFADALRLQCVASLPVVISLLGVVRLEAVATPPLETGAEAVEAALGTKPGASRAPVEPLILRPRRPLLSRRRRLRGRRAASPDAGRR
jgi:hypothetical protein